MPCSTFTNVVCDISGAASSVAAPAGNDFLDSLASSIRSALSWEFANTSTLWLKLPSPDLASQSAIPAVQGWLLPVTVAVAIGAVIAAGARMALTRRPNPLLDVSGGLALIGVVAAVGVLVPNLMLQAGDAWTSWILQVSTGGAFTERMQTLLSAGYGDGVPDVVVIILGAIGMMASAVQAALLLFRQAAIVILAAVLPLAAAGFTAPATRGWFKKVASWMLALICYKPAAAAVYATAFTMIGNGTGLRAILTGFAMIALSLVALPVLIRFFTWTTGAVSSSGGGMGQLFGMATAGALAMGALRGSGAGAATATQQAEFLSAAQSPPAPGEGGAGVTGRGGRPPGGHPPTGAGDSGPAASGRDSTPASSATPADPGPSPSSRPSNSSESTAVTGPSGPAGTAPGAAGGVGSNAAAPPDRGAPPGRGASSASGGRNESPNPGPEPSGPTAGGAPSGATAAGPGQQDMPPRTAPDYPRTGSAPAQADAAGASFAALFAAQALASGAANAASAATEEDRT